MDFKKDYYRVLGLSRSAIAEEIKSAYRMLAKKYHPDLNPNNAEYGELIKEVNEAYEVLGNSDSRFVYDSYKESEPSDIIEGPAGRASETNNKKANANQRTYTKKVVVTHVDKVYIKGDLFVKFRGRQDDLATSDILKEIIYNLKVTDVSATIPEDQIYKGKMPAQFKKVFAGEKVDIKIPQPVKCTVLTASGERFYKLDIRDLTIPRVVIENVTKDDGDSYGTVRGTFYGYVEYISYEEEEIKVAECFGETGRKEKKTENGIRYERKEYFRNDCTVYWGTWLSISTDDAAFTAQEKTAGGPFAGNPHTDGSFNGKGFAASSVNTGWNSNQQWGSNWKPAKQSGCLPTLFNLFVWVVTAVYIILILSQFVFLWPFVLMAFLFWLVSVKLWKWLFGVLAVLVLGVFLFALIAAFQRTVQPPLLAKDKPAELRPVKTPIENSGSDTLISHFRSWKDYDGRLYEGKYAVKKSDWINARNYKTGLQVASNREQGYDQVLYDLGNKDRESLAGLYLLLDSLRVKNHLSATQFAEMAVSMVQDIPYAVVLPQACDPKLYADKFISSYLSSATARCDGYEKFGINTPVEFLASLNGDCDTRTLLLYSVLAHYHYDVALLSSEFYNHSLIGINLPYEGVAYMDQERRYVLWETTSLFRPGVLPNEISNMDYWRISLKTK